jgi:GTP-binding protein
MLANNKRKTIMLQHPLYQRAKFLKSAPNLKHCTPDTGVEVAFVGRSNAGKSSSLNAITHQTGLAKVSKTPGRTQLINFFTLDSEERRLVDLPGYGFAKVPIPLKEEWGKAMGAYLETRQSLQGLILLMDARHPFMPLDDQLLQWAVRVGRPVHILLTKADKFSYGQQKNTLLAVQKQIPSYGGVITVQLFSSLKKTGMDEVWAKLDEWLGWESKNA